MRVLPDVATTGAHALFVGTAVGDCQALAGHHHAVRGDAFWELLHAGGFTRRRLSPEQEDLLPSYGLGLVDLLPLPGHEHGRVVFDVAALAAKVAALRPRWVILTSKRTGAVVARHLGERAPALGPTGWTMSGSCVYVLPSPSGANRRRDYDGRPSRIDWWAECARTVGAEG